MNGRWRESAGARRRTGMAYFVVLFVVFILSIIIGNHLPDNTWRYRMVGIDGDVRWTINSGTAGTGTNPWYFSEDRTRVLTGYGHIDLRSLTWVQVVPTLQE